nr:hypothetical protein BaRGS_010360 [Batillaria attramentaria]
MADKRERDRDRDTTPGSVDKDADEDVDVGEGTLEVVLPSPPDGGWGWVIVVASLMANIIVDGITYTFGIFLPKFQQAFQQPKRTIALAGSLQVGTYLCVGFGFGMMYLPAIVIVGYYFERRRALATGIAVCGSGIGMFIMAPLSGFLLREFDWKGALLVIAGIVFNGAVCGMLMRPLPFMEVGR